MATSVYLVVMRRQRILPLEHGAAFANLQMKDASASSRGAIVRIVVKPTTQQQVEAFKRLEGVPDLLKLVREAIENKQSIKHKEILAQQQRTTSTPPRKEPKAVAPLCILNQGSFALCSHFALATCAAHAFQAKYRMYVSDEALLSIWHQNAIPSKQMWQKQCAAFVGNFRLRSPKSFHNVMLQYNYAPSAAGIICAAVWKHLAVSGVC